MVVDRYKSYSVYKRRETFYRVLDGKETFDVFGEKTGDKAFSFVGFYNPKAILRPENKAYAVIRPEGTLEIFGVMVGLVRKTA